MGQESGACVDWMIGYTYEQLLICCGPGTPYEYFVYNMVEVEVEYADRYCDVLRSLGHTVPELDRELCHMIASGMCEAHVNDAVRKAFPVKKVTSSHSNGKTVILTEHDIDEAALRSAIGATGYEVKTVSKELYKKEGLFHR